MNFARSCWLALGWVILAMLGCARGSPVPLAASLGKQGKGSAIPLDDIETELPKRDKNQVCLLHCASGMRSGLAKGQFKGLGHMNTFNLRAYGRAERILKPPP